MTFPLLYLYTTTLDSTLFNSFIYIGHSHCSTLNDCRRVSIVTVSDKSRHIKLCLSESS